MAAEAESEKSVPTVGVDGGNGIAMAEPVAIRTKEEPELIAIDRTGKEPGHGNDLNFTDFNNEAMNGQIKGEVSDPADKIAVPVPVHHRRLTSMFNRTNFVWSFLVIVCVIGIVLAVVLTRKEPAEVGDPSISIDFSTGVSLVTSYAIDTVVRSRLARTRITMEVANALDCSSIHAISLQLPLNTRIASLKTITNDGCTSSGDVMELSQARETFLESASNGLASAYVEAQDDSFSHSLQVAIPPLGTSKVELILEQLLQQRLGEVTFDLPFAPNEKVDSVNFDLTVEDTAGQPVDFYIDFNVPGVYEGSSQDGNFTNKTSAIHLETPDARQYDLPQVIRGKYNPGNLPENGRLYTDGKCFEHFFHPASSTPMPRNFLFVLDTSQSMNYDSKLESAKTALTSFIDNIITPEDTFTIQTFGNKGTANLWGSGKGTVDEKEDAKQFVNSLVTSRMGTNLHEAFLEGLLRAKHDAEMSNDNVATILIMISGAYASRGETNRIKIAEHVFELNEEGVVKIFSLGFQGSADMQLLDAIALMNGGVSAPIIQGQDDFAQQITSFLESELGSILMSDVIVKYSAGPTEAMEVIGETQTIFPVLADGYEVVVRGLIRDSDDVLSLNSITTASTMNGVKNWELSATPNTEDAAKSSLCFQSYAHDRITQLLRYYDASDFLGSDLIKRLVTLSRNDCKEDDFAKCVRKEALRLAIEANVVAKGLTAMVTIDDEQCTKPDEEAEICLDGTTPDGTPPRDHSDGDYYDMSSESERSYGRSGATAPSHSWVSLFALLSALFFAAILDI